MTTADMGRMATETLRRAGIADERGVTVQECFASSGAQNFDDFLGDMIPGASMLVNAARRVVVVTERNVYLFRGRSFDRPSERLAKYQIDTNVITRNGNKLVFPDGQAVYLSAYQAKTVVDAVRAPAYKGMADALLRHARLSGERAITMGRGTVPKTPENSLAARVFDVTFGGGDLDFRETLEFRMILVTDRNVYLFAGREPSELGGLICKLPVGKGALSVDNKTLRFQDGEFVNLDTADDAKRLADAAEGTNS